ncbi:hypothetical protein Nwi_2937 [Nitrobacter winogradskyi Nb-255]|uniref:Uncharacterized protein n=1 Tax=Nitrobacter winogradskyi (strain ATCC 25391 / DSM 10237 / CIP 104748 / NCIMB 11846 / Nb-255) TaxID=323098 RepID=Q3SNF4_NITWN|nr:hypothetical protein Nwi_2937 [Nitrobacter winogradskyi Nb-255]
MVKERRYKNGSHARRCSFRYRSHRRDFGDRDHRDRGTIEELTKAWAWVNNNEALINEGRALPSGRTAELVELLTPQDDEE